MKTKKRLDLLEELESDSSKRLDLMNEKISSISSGNNNLRKLLTTLTERFNSFESSGNKYLSGRLDDQKTQLFEISQLFDGHAQKIADMAKRVDYLGERFNVSIKTLQSRKMEIDDLSKRIDQLIRVFDQMDIRLAKLEQVKQKKDDLDCRMTLIEESLKNDAIREKVFGRPKKSAAVRTKHPGKPKKKSARSKR